MKVRDKSRGFSEMEIDKIVVEQAEDDSACERSIRVRKTKTASVSISSEFRTHSGLRQKRGKTNYIKPFKFSENSFPESIVENWKGSVLQEETTLHQIAPHIGKMKSSIASTLVSTFTSKTETVYDPFCGSGTIAFEAWSAGRNIIANDLSPYALVLTKAKLFPYLSIEETIKSYF